MTTCPACGVAVVPGYVKCPRCNARLPSIRFRRPGTTVEAGGTAVDSGERAFPIVPVILALVLAGGFAAFFGFRRGGKDDAVAPPPVVAIAPAPPSAPLPPVVVPTVPSAPTAPAAPRPDAVAADLQASLEHQRLWSTVRAIGTRLEISSRTCEDPQMKPAVETVVARAHAAGLTSLRCVEQSGVVAFTRDF